MSRKLKVKKLGLGEKVLELRGKGKGLRTIAQQLSKETGKNISHLAVKNFLDSSYSITKKTLARREDYEEKITDQVLDAAQELKKISTKLDKSLEEIDPTNKEDMKILIKLSREKRKQLKFYKEFIEKVAEADYKEEANYSEALELVDKMEELEDEGLIVWKGS